MVYMKVHCSACGGTWEVYNRQQDLCLTSSRICPHCRGRIDGDIWSDKILPAFQAVGAANMALAYDHTENHNVEFSIDYIADGKFQNADKADIMNELYELEANVSDIQDMLNE